MEVSEQISEPKELKFRAFEFCPDADKILILDADTIIRSDCPSIFQYDNAAVLSSQSGLDDVSSDHDYNLICKKYPRLKMNSINSGILLLSKKNCRILDTAFDIHKTVSGRIGVDQAPLNYALSKASLTLLDYSWNYRGPAFPEPMQAYIYHFAGQGVNRYIRYGGMSWFHSTIKDRTQFPTLLKDYSIGAEIGVHRGLFSETILRQWQGHLYLIDLWKHQSPEIYQSTTCNQSDKIQEQVYQEAMARTCILPGKSTVIREDSAHAASIVGKLDFVYIDANHSFEATLADLESYYPLVKPGGLIAGHDFLDGMIGGCNFGVKKAVFEFLKDKPYSLYVTNEQFPTWYFYKE
jgi:hypothetical protein